MDKRKFQNIACPKCGSMEYIYFEKEYSVEQSSN